MLRNELGEFDISRSTGMSRASVFRKFSRKLFAGASSTNTRVFHDRHLRAMANAVDISGERYVRVPETMNLNWEELP